MRRYLLKELPPLRQAGIRFTSGSAIRNRAAFGVGYLRLTGAAGSRAFSGDKPVFDITGDIEMIVSARFADVGLVWATLMSKGNINVVGGQYVFTKRGTTDGTQIRVEWRDASQVLKTFNSATGAAVLTDRWYKVTVDVDNGATGHDVKFYVSDDPPETPPGSVIWTQHGTTQTGAGVTSIQAGADPLSLGEMGGSNLMLGHIYYAELRNGINGTVVANPDFRWRTDLP